MLPTTGFFKDIDCPYYTNSCKRPYCHFKHRKKKLETPVAAQDVPTYNPTPKSQLASTRSHIPISYVPDLVIRTERSNMRTYGYTGVDKPTYNPTPLSILSTAKNTVSCEENSDYTPTVIIKKESVTSEPIDNENDVDNVDEINFEDLETEFNMIDEIIGDSKDINGKVNDESSNKSQKPDEKKKSKQKTNCNDSSVSSKDDTKISETSNGSSTSSSRSKKDKHKSHSNHSSKSSSKSRSKQSDKKESSKSSKSSSKDKERSRSKERRKDHKSKSKDKKHESKDKHKESSKSSHKSRSNESKKEKKGEEKKDKKGEEKKEKKGEEKKEKKGEEKKEKKGEEKKEKKGEEKKQKKDEEKKNDYEEKKSDPEEKINEFNFDISEDSDMSDLDPLEECYKIFTEYKPTEPELFPVLRKEEKDQDDENLTSVPMNNKKRIAHDNADKGKQNIVFNKPKYIPSAAQTMVNRLKAARLTQASNEQNNIISEINRHILKRPLESLSTNSVKVQKTSIVTKTITSKPTTSTSLIDSIITGKSTNKPKRIAPVQNVDSIQRAKAKVQELAKLNAINATKTTSQTLQKGAQRTAHVPEYAATEIPDVLSAERSKLPVNVRTRYLTMMLDECVKLYIDTEEAQQRALNEEFKCYERCAALVTYRNSAMLAINRLRKQLQEREVQGLGPIFPGEGADTSKTDTNNLQSQKFYNSIKQYLLNNEELILHGFPREGQVPGRAIIKNQKHVSKGYLDENERTCCRCLKVYKVDDDGFALYEQECSYHPLKKRTFRGESIYLCCKSNEDYGCVTAATHVCETMISEDGEIEGYQTTMPPDGTNDPRSYAVFALDCEMCYTTKGLELTRVTIVNSDLKTVYESLVKPLNPIIDYNTRFSGITEEQMNRTATSILQVQANILHLCNSNTILIGHSLESDMKALKIIHDNIIDTSVLFPHKFGLPHKRALRELAREYLKKLIQNDVSGHDSAEDALTCMELVQWKIKEEMKARGVKF